MNATTTSKNEMGLWSVLDREPINYTTGEAVLQNVIPTTSS